MLGLIAVNASCGAPASGVPAAVRPHLARRAAPTGVPTLAQPCGRATTPPRPYRHVVLLVEENRTWTGGRSPAVGMGFSARTMPFLHGLATKCSFFADWSETNAAQNSLNQYIGLTSGVLNSKTVNDCSPSPTCRSTDDNLFRQVRAAGGSARTFVDGATAPCSASGNAAKHIPALYYQGAKDATFCTAEVRPFSQFDPGHLPTFTMIVPNLCHDGHDCSDATVDAWAKTTLSRILDGESYRAGKTLVVVVYDEDRPVPNLLIAPTANAGSIRSRAGSHAALLKTIEEALALPILRQGQLTTAVSLRSSAHI